MYKFNYKEITEHHLHQIEYSIIDNCNRNCRACSHFAPLAKKANAVSVAEFVKNTEMLHVIAPDVHTFWLIGGEPTLHPQYLDLLKKLRYIFKNVPIGIMSNGYGVLVRENDAAFWKFIRDNEVVWRITTYDVNSDRYVRLFEHNHCSELLSLDINNRFMNLAVLTETEQEVSAAKYTECGWERLNIFVRGNRIWKCPTVEYIDLFNGYFDKNFAICTDDYLEIDHNLTREKLLSFQNCASSFCRNCDLSQRFKMRFEVKKSKKCISEWLDNRC